MPHLFRRRRWSLWAVLAAAVFAFSSCMTPRVRYFFIDQAPETGGVVVESSGGMCEPARREPDPATSAPMPDTDQADHSFPGDFRGQREFVFLHEDGSYDYVERWRFGIFIPVGYDWKVGCRIHRCERTDGVACCYQTCSDGGDSGIAYEPGDAHGCMNYSSGTNKYQWFLNGLIESGVLDAAGCE